MKKNKENETNETRYFCGKRSKLKGNGKKKKHETIRFYRKKKDYKKGKQGDTQKEKGGKKTKENKKKLKKNEQKMMKKKKINGGKNKRTKEDKTRG